MPAVRIVADENIPYVIDAFSTLGDVATVHGRTVTTNVLEDAEILLVRSVTKVNEDLLANTAVRFVATATIGLDHIDQEYLRSRGIALASAPGSNADSVAEYVTAALLSLGARHGLTLAGMTAGVIGVGNVGSRVAGKLSALGMTVLKNDPPLRRQTGDTSFLPIGRLLGADVITVHVPLAHDGPDATYHLIDADFLAKLKPGTILLNTSRGGVAHTQALLDYAAKKDRGPIVLDVWENEPAICAALLDRVDLGTPHIAGYSFDGKVRGCQMIYDAACRFLGVEPSWDSRAQLPPPPHPRIDLPQAGTSEDDMLRRAVLTVYDIEADDARLRRMLSMQEADRGPHFDQLRKDYPVRREFTNTTIAGADRAVRDKLGALGFALAAE